MINDPNGSDTILAIWVIAVLSSWLVIAWVAYRTGTADGFDEGYDHGYERREADDAAQSALDALDTCAVELHELFDVEAPDAAVYQFPRTTMAPGRRS